MKRFITILFFAFVSVIIETKVSDGAVALPKPSLDGKVPVEKAIQQRRTIREFKETPLSIPHLGQLLWAAQGITDPEGVGRSAPSGGARYPLDIYVIVGKKGDASVFEVTRPYCRETMGEIFILCFLGIMISHVKHCQG